MLCGVRAERRLAHSGRFGAVAFASSNGLAVRGYDMAGSSPWHSSKTPCMECGSPVVERPNPLYAGNSTMPVRVDIERRCTDPDCITRIAGNVEA